jgi:NADH-quinone oxidoreductase subunit A
MDNSYFGVGVMILLGLTIGGLFLGLSSMIGQRPPPKTRLLPYECGLDQASSPRQRFAIHFFLTAMLFLLFDVEITFLIPWAVLFREFQAAGLGMFIFVEGLVFIAILGVGLAYVWRRGALEWER